MTRGVEAGLLSLWQKLADLTATASSTPPTEPGLGAKIDFDLIERKKVGILS